MTAPQYTKASRRFRMWTPIGVHAASDFTSFVIISLLPLLKTTIGFSDTQKALLLACGAVASGLIQPVVAIWTDRFDARWIAPLGLAVATAGVAAVGFVQSFESLLMLHILIALGGGAFHPAAAAVAGHLGGNRRAMALTAFFCAGMIGGISGNVLTPRVVDFFAEQRVPIDTTFGLRSLAWCALPGALCVIVLAKAIVTTPHRDHDSHEHHARLPKEERASRWFAVGLLYITNVLRFSTNNALVYLADEWAKRATRRRTGVDELTERLAADASKLNGMLQAAQQVGMGLGAVALGFVLSRGREKAAFVFVPLVGAAAIAVFGPVGRLLDGVHLGPQVGSFCLLVIAGFGFGSTHPVSIRVAQRLLPHRTSLASGLMLGGAWSLSAIGPFAAKWLHQGFGKEELARGDARLDSAILVTAGVLAVSGALALLLPKSAMRSA